MTIILALVASGGQAQTALQTSPGRTMKSYTKVSNGYVMVLRQGQHLFEELERFASEEKIPAANFTGMGFVNITFGYFDFDTKQYLPGEFANVELASMHGSIAWKEGKPSIHAHGVVGDQSFETHSGHILKGTVSTGSVEIVITVHNKRFERRRDETLGADVLDISID
ncbi:MAG TPA: PPC domain-containing DNA-binding protein [Chryseolinea sp.]|nr:PPC domain-containing DNA-binding protein [Chryseolinea sp.]